MTLLIVGAGPAGLATALALHCRGLSDEVEVVDPAGRWLAAWDRRFSAQDIPHLRSPSVHHPHPNPFKLLEHTDHDALVPSGGTQLPTTEGFATFCDRIVGEAGLADRVTATAVSTLTVDDRGRPEVALSDGRTRRPDRVVLATNARHRTVPVAAADLCSSTGPVQHAEDVDVRQAPPGGHVVVVGGGLSAAHLALGALRRGARVTLVTRRRLEVRRFDVHPSWLGPKKRRPFESEPDPVRRRRAVDQARGGGTIPHRYRRALDECEEAGLLALRERRHLRTVAVDGDRVHLGLEGDAGVVEELEADRLWLATGGSIDVTADPLCRDLAARFPTPVIDGLPELDHDLCWPGTRVHLAGFAAALRLGPTAGNLVGQRRAGLRIAAAARGHDPIAADRLVTGAAACPGA